MTYRPAPVPPGAVPVPAIAARLEPDAIAAGMHVMLTARFGLRSPFFQTARERA